MTQPDQLRPKDAANYGSFAEYAATTEDEWREQMRGQTSRHLKDTKTGFNKIGRDIRTIIANFVQGWSGEGGSGWQLGDVFDTAASQKRETTQIAAGLAQLQADVSANNNSGKTYTVNVADYGAAVPSTFTRFSDAGSGAIYNDGNTLQMSNDDGRELLGYNVAPLVTDFFEVSLIVPKQAGKTFGNYVNRALYFLGRGDSTWSNYCLARLNGNKLRVGAVINGVSTLDSPTWFGSGASGAGPNEITVSPGVYMTFAGGTLAGSRVFQFKVNNQVRATFADSSAASLLGDNYRWVGCGIRNDNDAVNQSPSISHFMANDNAPAEIVGSIATLSRLSTSLVAVSSGTNPLPSGFWDNQEEVSAEMLSGLNVPAGTVAIPKSRQYTITAQSRCGTSWPNHFQWVLYKNGLPYKRLGSDHMFGSNALGGTIIPDLAGGSWTGYLYEGDIVKMGYNTDGAALNALRGSADGAQTYWTIGAA